MGGERKEPELHNHSIDLRDIPCWGEKADRKGEKGCKFLEMRTI